MTPNEWTAQHSGYVASDGTYYATLKQARTVSCRLAVMGYTARDPWRCEWLVR